MRILGVGNGDPAFRDPERPDKRDARHFSVKTFNGLAQVLLQSSDTCGVAQLTVRMADSVDKININVSDK